MNIRATAFGVAKLLQILAIFMLFPLGIALFDHRNLSFMENVFMPDSFGFIVAIIVSAIVGFTVAELFKAFKDKQSVKEGFAIVTFGWIALAFFGSIPLFYVFIEGCTVIGFLDYFGHFTNAYFEIMSGFSTTGATILTDIEAAPRSILFWRALTHWLGGMGIVTLALAIFPALGVSGYQMFKGEVPGPSADRLQPRLAETARILWTVYVFFTAAETLILWGAGMTFFDAISHAFATMATGGFSTKNASIAAFDSEIIHWTITFFMYLAGANFLVHYKVLRGNLSDFKNNAEFKFYTGVIISAILFITLVLYFQGTQSPDLAARSYRVSTEMSDTALSEHVLAQSTKLDGLYNSFKHASFQVLAIVTTTGFSTADFDVWPHMLRLLLVMLMFFGGSAGSTGGGMKMVRILIIFKYAYREIRKIMNPRLIQSIKLSGHPIEEKQVANIVGFGFLFVMIFVFFSFIMTIFIPDLTTAATSVIAALGNIGPGLGAVGSIENYAWISIPGKWVLIFAMLLGRLEIFTVLVIFRFSSWRK